jgi:prepilin-type processing-associated H-X9-DG protein
MDRKPCPSDISTEELNFVATYLTLIDEEAPQRLAVQRHQCVSMNAWILRYDVAPEATASTQYSSVWTTPCDPARPVPGARLDASTYVSFFECFAQAVRGRGQRHDRPVLAQQHHRSCQPGLRPECAAHGGDAIANVLFGDGNPSGKLPQTFPKSEADLNVVYSEGLRMDYRWFNAALLHNPPSRPVVER